MKKLDKVKDTMPGKQLVGENILSKCEALGLIPSTKIKCQGHNFKKKVALDFRELHLDFYSHSQELLSKHGHLHRQE